MENKFTKLQGARSKCQKLVVNILFLEIRCFNTIWPIISNILLFYGSQKFWYLKKSKKLTQNLAEHFQYVVILWVSKVLKSFGTKKNLKKNSHKIWANISNMLLFYGPPPHLTIYWHNTTV